MLITSSVKEISDLVSQKPGAIFAYPTETFYGFGCKITDNKAIIRIISAKRRDAAKGMIVLAEGIDQAKKLALIDSKQQTLLKAFWPGALSVILQALPDLNPLIAPEGSVALRVSPNKTALELVRMIGPVISTSANPSGMVPATTAEEVERYGLDIDAILDGGITPGGAPSTLVDLTGDAPVCLRQGVIPFEKVLEVWNSIE